MVAVRSGAAAVETSTDMVPPTATQNKHQSRYHRRPAFGDGYGTGIIGFAPASKYKRRASLACNQKNPKARRETRGRRELGALRVVPAPQHVHVLALLSHLGWQ